jgi:two-component system sensor histidine kinase TctE
MSIAITYLVAKSIANQPFDHALEDSVTVLAQQVRAVDGKVIKSLPGSARDILRADDIDNVYFQIQGRAASISTATATAATGAGRRRQAHQRRRALPQRQHARHAGAHRLRLRALERKPGAEAPLALVQVAETLENAPSWPTPSSRA